MQASVKPRTSALSNLERMFKNFPVVTTQTSKLRFDKVINFAAPPAEANDSVLSKSLVFTSLMTSVNPFARFIIQEIIDRPSYSVSEADQKYWELDEAIFGRQTEPVKRENLLKTSFEMFAIYKFSNDPQMRVKSDRYTGGEFKQVLELVDVEESLLESSQMTNAVFMIKQQQQL